jgi:hypothetical protein
MGRASSFSMASTGLIALTLLGCERLSHTDSTKDVWTIFQSNKARAATQARAHSERCSSLGLKPGTEDYKICRNRLRAYGTREPLL